MWTPSVNFITLHYAYIIFMGFLGLVILYPYGNMRAIDAYFFGASASTESGLNTVDIKELKTYQQLYIYFIPIFTNLGFINILVVVVRLYWFEKRLKETGSNLYHSDPHRNGDIEAANHGVVAGHVTKLAAASATKWAVKAEKTGEDGPEKSSDQDPPIAKPSNTPAISFADDVKLNGAGKALYIPPPWERDQGRPITEVDDDPHPNGLERARTSDSRFTTASSTTRRRRTGRSFLLSSPTIERVASSMFVLGSSASRSQPVDPQAIQETRLSKQLDLPEFSSHATVGRNSQFRGLTAQDRQRLGGIEYRSLKLLLKIVTCYFFGIHLLGALCLLPWIRNSDPKYRNYLKESGQDSTWWAFYSAQTMVNNLGFTLTPDSMISFRDARWPMFVLSFLAYAGNTCYPCLLRLIIWIMSKASPRKSSMRQALSFLLAHPRRCYTLLFPSKPTWILFGIVFTMNFIDIILILVLDLDNPEVNSLPAGPRIMAAIFQSASARHTGTASFNLANVHPAVQFSLVVMMYIAIFPIAISVRASNTYEEKALGFYHRDHEMDEKRSRSYVLTHVRNQLTFDLWYIFLGIFCICIAEADRITDLSNTAFTVFSIFFEVTSAYGNVGLSLGYPTGNTSLSGQFTTFSKLVICAMMIRGRHRGLPYQVDRAILLPRDQLSNEHEDHGNAGSDTLDLPTIKNMHTS